MMLDRTSLSLNNIEDFLIENDYDNPKIFMIDFDIKSSESVFILDQYQKRLIENNYEGYEKEFIKENENIENSKNQNLN